LVIVNPGGGSVKGKFGKSGENHESGGKKEGGRIFNHEPHEPHELLL
jgi:hypothetical protein